MVFRALADLFMVHEIPATPIGICGHHRYFPGGDTGRRQQLARLAALNQFGCILEGCWPIETLPKGLPDQRAGGRVTPALALVDVGEKLAAFFSRDAPEKDPVYATLI